MAFSNDRPYRDRNSKSGLCPDRRLCRRNSILRRWSGLERVSGCDSYDCPPHAQLEIWAVCASGAACTFQVNQEEFVPIAIRVECRVVFA
jgi:hypothetical protein